MFPFDPILIEEKEDVHTGAPVDALTAPPDPMTSPPAVMAPVPPDDDTELVHLTAPVDPLSARMLPYVRKTVPSALMRGHMPL